MIPQVFQTCSTVPWSVGRECIRSVQAKGFSSAALVAVEATARLCTAHAWFLCVFVSLVCVEEFQYVYHSQCMSFVRIGWGVSYY